MKHPYFLNDRIRLRAMEPEDLDVIYEIENEPKGWDISNFTVPYSRYAIKQYMENSQCDMFADKQLRMMIVRRADDVVIGIIDISDFIPMHSRGEVGIVIRREFRGEGYAKDALMLLCDYAFDFLYLKQLTAHIAVDNETSLHLFTSCGFKRCGLLKSWWFLEGGFKDVVLLQRIREA
ncbi:MAG: GNAT family N-acetyltransferase [Bacteroides sp.]|jgi:diamine N-acetyltransferase|nr:GNAT family N-acetyltransferase [Bacteroides sp.]MCI1683019.1 GNAT family N-acetyltransferase [Bacteroides sp.]